MRNAFVKGLEEMSKENDNLFFLTGDLGFGVLDKLQEILGDRFINAGISEQNMASVAAGIAQAPGTTVYMYSIGNFAGMRCLEQIRNDICYAKANVKIVIVGGGFAYGQLGMTHHATEDLAVMRALPNMNVFSPADPTDAINALKRVNAINGPCYVRLGKGGEQELNRIEVLGEDNLISVLHEGKEGLIIGTGSVLQEAYNAALCLGKDGIDIMVIDCAIVKPFPQIIEQIMESFQWIVSIEEHSIIGGLGDAIAGIIASKDGCKPALHKLGLNDCFTEIVGSQAYLREVYGLSSKRIQIKIKEIMEEHKR